MDSDEYVAVFKMIYSLHNTITGEGRPGSNNDMNAMLNMYLGIAMFGAGYMAGINDKGYDPLQRGADPLISLKDNYRTGRGPSVDTKLLASPAMSASSQADLTMPKYALLPVSSSCYK